MLMEATWGGEFDETQGYEFLVEIEDEKAAYRYKGITWY